MPTPRIHTHCQVAQNSLRTDQNLSKSMAAQTHGKTEEIKHENTTHNIANKGFSGMRRFVARFNFSCNLIGNHPQSLTGHIVNVSHNLKLKHEIHFIIDLCIFFFDLFWTR